MLVFVRRKLPVPTWQVVDPGAGLIVLGLHAVPQRDPVPAPGRRRVVPRRVGRPGCWSRSSRSSSRPRHGPQARESRWPPARASRLREKDGLASSPGLAPAGGRGGLLGGARGLLACVADQPLARPPLSRGAGPGRRTEATLESMLTEEDHRCPGRSGCSTPGRVRVPPPLPAGPGPARARRTRLTTGAPGRVGVTEVSRGSCRRPGCPCCTSTPASSRSRSPPRSNWAGWRARRRAHEIVRLNAVAEAVGAAAG